MTRWHRWLLASLVAVLVAGASIATAGPSGGATTLRPVTGLGNGSHGPLVKQADAASGQLVGHAGTGLSRGVTPSAVRLGCVADAATYPGFSTGLEAAFHAVNRKGGIFGRKLTLVGSCDDTHGRSATDSADTEALVDQTHAFALLTLSDARSGQPTAFLNAEQVPYVGWGLETGFCGTRWGFGWNGCLDNPATTGPPEVLDASTVEAAIRASGLSDAAARIAIVSDGADSGAIGTYQAEIGALGSQLVYSEDAYPTTTLGVDNDPYVQAIVAAQPDVVLLLLAATDASPLAVALRANGYAGLVTTPTSSTPFVIEASSTLEFGIGLPGVAYATQTVPPQQHSAFGDQVAGAVTAQGATSVTLGAFVGYAEADMLIGMLRAAGRELNTRSFTQAVNGSRPGLTSYATTPDGAPGKLVWPAAHYLPADCAAVVKATSSSTAQVVAPFSCYTAVEVTPAG